MLALKDSRLMALMLVAPKAQKQIAKEVGLKAAQVRVLLAVTTLTSDYASSVEVRELMATKLYAPTRLRAYVRDLVLADCITRRRRYAQYQLSLTPKGKKVARDCVLVIHRMAGTFVNP